MSIFSHKNKIETIAFLSQFADQSGDVLSSNRKVLNKLMKIFLQKESLINIKVTTVILMFRSFMINGKLVLFSVFLKDVV